MDVQPGINSPVSSKSSVIGPHVDNKKEIYAGLLYMRLSDDNSIGGNLQIYKHRFLTKDYISEKYDRKDRPNESDLELHATIPYKRNTFVMLLSSNISFHGVSDRGLTKFNRRLVNIISEKK